MSVRSLIIVPADGSPETERMVDYAVRVARERGAPESAIPAYAQLTGASAIVVGRNYGTPGLWRSTWIDELVLGSTLRGVLRRAKTPVLVLPVVAGAHEWIDEVTGEESFTIPSTADTMARRAA